MNSVRQNANNDIKLLTCLKKISGELNGSNPKFDEIVKKLEFMLTYKQNNSKIIEKTNKIGKEVEFIALKNDMPIEKDNIQHNNIKIKNYLCSATTIVGISLTTGILTILFMKKYLKN
jgi:hypothetical protein